VFSGAQATVLEQPPDVLLLIAPIVLCVPTGDRKAFEVPKPLLQPHLLEAAVVWYSTLLLVFNPTLKTILN